MKAFEEELLRGVRNDLEDRFEQFADETRSGLVQIVKDRFKQVIDQLSDKEKDREACPAPLQAQQLSSLSEIPTIDEFDFDSFLANTNTVLGGDEFIFTETINGDFLYASDASDSAYVSMDSPRSPRKAELVVPELFCEGH
jgi:hypothetical protein